MGKRKAKTKPAPKKRMDKLDTVFCCPFCNHGSSVECRMYYFLQHECFYTDYSFSPLMFTSFFHFSDMKNLIGEASCMICQENFSTTVTGILIFCAALLLIIISCFHSFSVCCILCCTTALTEPIDM